MAARKKNKRKKGAQKLKKAGGNPIKLFRRQIFRSSSVRAGIAAARNTVAPEQIATVVRDLAKAPMFSDKLFDVQFPENLSKLTQTPRLPPVSPDREFMWSAAVLSLHSKEISIFASLRDEYESNYLVSDWDKCDECLAEIESSLGVSIWLISRKLHLLQLAHGHNAQKDYLELVLGTRDISSIAAILSWYVSLRCEENVTLEMFESELTPLLQPRNDLSEYIRYQLIPYDITGIEDESRPIAFAENQPIIDRYLVHLWMAELSFARKGAAGNHYVTDSLELLKDVIDPRLQKLTFLSSNNAPMYCPENIKAFDSYTEGRYEDVASKSISHMEVKARSTLFLEGNAAITNSIEEEVRFLMGEMLLISGDYTKSKQSLKKLAMTCFNMPISIKIASFIERTQENIFENDYSVIEKLHAIHGDSNPWDCSPLSSCLTDINVLESSLKNNPDSSSLLLQKAITLECDDGLRLLDKISIPELRKVLYRGHILFRNGRTMEAIAHYRVAQNSNVEYVVSRANLFLFRVLFSEKLYGECIDLVVSHYFKNTSVVAVYPLEELSVAGLENTKLFSSISLAILLSLSARHVNPKRDRDLSDIYENILLYIGVEKPSEIDSNNCLLNIEELTYFLKYICVQRIMDDSITFDSDSEIENERVKICVNLIEIDPEGIESYSREIKSIIRSERASEFFNKVHASKIYIDSDGILSATEQKLKGLYHRYRKLLDSPGLSLQSDKMSTIIGKLLSDISSSELASLSIPISVKDALFEEMLQFFVDQFVFNPAYGLDANMSTTIRHGAFEGHIRRAFSAKDLLSERNSVTGRYTLPEIWQNRFSDFSAADSSHLSRCVERFSIRLEKTISLYLDTLLRISTEENTEGMFSFNNTREALNSLSEKITSSSTFDDLSADLLEYTWSLADKSMENIRERIMHELRAEINQAVDTLVTSIERKIPHNRVVVLVDTIISAKTEFNSNVVSVANWFQRSKEFGYDPFSFELVLDVAGKQIQYCHADLSISVSHKFEVYSNIKGEYFTGFTEIFFILLQNAAMRSGITQGPIEVEVKVTVVDGDIVITVKNNLCDSIDLEDRTNSAKVAEKNYEKDTAMKMARKEGGSGLSKVWRILEHDIKCKHSIKLSVSDSYHFTAMLTIKSNTLLEL